MSRLGSAFFTCWKCHGAVNSVVEFAWEQVDASERQKPVRLFLYPMEGCPVSGLCPLGTGRCLDHILERVLERNPRS